MLKRLVILLNLSLLVILMNTEISIGNTYNNVEINPKMVMTIKEREVRSCYIEMNCTYQYPELPTGCEITSLTNVLNYYGFNVDKCFMADYYLLYYNDYYQVGFQGSPYSYDGTMAYPKCIVDSANNFLRDNSSNLCAYEISGTDFYQLFDYIKQGIPVMIWITGSFNWPEYTGEFYHNDGYGYWNYWDEHCVVMNGFDLDNELVYICDPMHGEHAANMSWIKSLYEGCGMLAAVIY